MALTTIPQIETAMNQIEAKKTALKTAFENLQSHSTSLSSFPITWPELETHFSTLQSSLLSSFSSLKTQQPESIPARPELITLCQNNDGVGLRKFLIDHPKDITNIRTEMADAFARAADPGLMVLDSLNGFCHGKVSAESKFRTVCVLMLEELCKCRERIVVSEEVKEKAKRIAEEWRKKIEGEGEGDGGMERLGYLHLVAAYGLGEEWGDREVNEVVDCVVSVARYRQSVELCRSLGIRARIPGPIFVFLLLVFLFVFVVVSKVGVFVIGFQ